MAVGKLLKREIWSVTISLTKSCEKSGDSKILEYTHTDIIVTFKLNSYNYLATIQRRETTISDLVEKEIS